MALNEIDQLKLASGDNNDLTPTDKNEVLPDKILDESAEKSIGIKTSTEQVEPNGNSSKNFDNDETKLKERIAQCKEILTSLKLELHEEKVKLSKEGRVTQLQSIEPLSKLSCMDNNEQTIDKMDDFSFTTDIYPSSVNHNLHCDENLLEYEKQLLKYQKTLNMAQIEKKNAIRKQMLAKAFKLKLLEVENQCNIELIRIKQSLQCLEPLKLIADKWKTNNNDNHYDTFELIPRYPEFSTFSGSDASSISNADDNDNKLSI
ncbi:unnamed protein product [Euphydryas editha]|uniref:Uncharacterized protein n=1 Tax=Euphydryas editha TaxID=104508 RepID=A0AAU9V1D8_EUPED|nr:unnamed protein product [Euphydryas editha]